MGLRVYGFQGFGVQVFWIYGRSGFRGLGVLDVRGFHGFGIQAFWILGVFGVQGLY